MSSRKKYGKRCPTCWGQGKVTNRLSKLTTCPTCKGTGRLPLEKEEEKKR